MSAANEPLKLATAVRVVIVAARDTKDRMIGSIGAGFVYRRVSNGSLTRPQILTPILRKFKTATVGPCCPSSFA
jgi:hypothetical protein